MSNLKVKQSLKATYLNANQNQKIGTFIAGQGKQDQDALIVPNVEESKRMTFVNDETHTVSDYKLASNKNYTFSDSILSIPSDNLNSDSRTE